MTPSNLDPYGDGGPRPGEVLLLPRHVARSLPEAASALGTSRDVVARLLLRGRLAPAVLLPRWRPALAAVAGEADTLARMPVALLPAVEDELVGALLEAARRATPAPSADTSRASAAPVAGDQVREVPPAHDAPLDAPDPLYAVRVREWAVIGRELRLRLEGGQAVAWPLDRHPALARLDDAALARDLARWADAASTPTWVWGTDDSVTLVAILRDPACRLLPAKERDAARGEGAS